MDVSIGHLRLAGRVVGSRERDPTPGVVELLTGPTAREHLLTALTSAFDGEEVLVIRSLACATTLRADTVSAPTVLAGSITASAAQLLREHPADDECVVRFPDEAAYLAAYVHDCLDGNAHRWYYDAFEPFRRRDGSTDLATLLATHRALRWRVLTRVRRHGDLDALLDALGDRAADLVEDGRDEEAGWSALVISAAAIVRAAVGASVSIDDRATSILANTEPPPDWRDAASLGRALAAATVALRPGAALSTDGTVKRLLAAARDHDWFDQDAFAAGLAARGAGGSDGDDAPLAPVLSPRARQVLTDLAAVVADPHLVLDPERPSSPRNLVSLVAALVEAAPRWDDDDLARAVSAHVLRAWGATPLDPSAPSSASSPSVRGALAPRATPTVAGSAAAHPSPWAGSPGPTDSGSVPPAPPPTTPVEVARLLDKRFLRPDEPAEVCASSLAGALLMLRALLDLGLSSYLLGRVGRDDEPLLVALMRRWSGAPVGDDPVLAAVLEAAGDPVPVGRLDDACGLAVARLLRLRVVARPLHLVAVPHGATGVAAVVADESAHLLPSTGADLDLSPAPDDATWRGTVADALAAVSVGHDGYDDLVLDLLAVSCVQAWARWLPGFAGSSVPFLLTTFVRRPAAVAVSDDEITVLMPHRSHDIVLELAGYLEPLDAGPTLGGRRIHFVTEESRGT